MADDEEDRVEVTTKAVRDALIANPDDAESAASNDYLRHSPLWLLSFGAYGDTHVYVWTDTNEGVEGAFERAVEALDDWGLCGFFTTLDEGDLRSAAEDAGYSEEDIDEMASSKEWADDVIEAAEVDLTVIGHTSLTNCEKTLGGGPLYIPSYEWFVREVDDAEEIEQVYAASYDATHDEDEEWDEGQDGYSRQPEIGWQKGSRRPR